MKVSEAMIRAASNHVGNTLDDVVIKGMLSAALLADPITIKARYNIEAMMGMNDIFPGDDVTMRFTTLAEAWDNLQAAMRRLEDSRPPEFTGAFNYLETARLIMGSALMRETI